MINIKDVRIIKKDKPVINILDDNKFNTSIRLIVVVRKKM